VAAGRGRLNVQLLRERAAAMLERVTAEAAAALGEEGTAPVRAALAAALHWRDDRIADDHDPRLLHPARTILIMLSDGASRSPDALAAAAFVDSVDAGLTPFVSALGAAAGAGAVRLRQAVPLPDAADEQLLERLVSAGDDVALTALAERLDHARHLHQRAELEWRPFHSQLVAVYVPVARRCAPRIAQRMEHWALAFARRLGPAG
jgi:hypothetical protein